MLEYCTWPFYGWGLGQAETHAKQGNIIDLNWDATNSSQ